MIEVAAVAVLAVIALLYQAHRFGRERQGWQDACEREREAWRDERRELNSRIQAPELAPTLAVPEPGGGQFHIPEGDEEAFEDYERALADGEVS